MDVVKTAFRLIIIINLISVKLCIAGLNENNITNHRFKITDSFEIPYFRNIPINGLNKYSDIYRAIIIIHGVNSNAGDYFNNIIKITNDDDLLDSTVVIAPQFINFFDRLISYKNSKEILFWNSWEWTVGFPANNNLVISPFDVIDQIIERITKDSNINDIVIVGHSAGGQFVNRYSAISQITPDNDISVRYIIANPSTYLYFDNNRIIESIYRKPKISEFIYNSYKYGTKGINLLPYLWHKPKFSPDLFRNRDNIILLGDRDIQRSLTLDKTVAAELQGENRFQRGLNYKYHLDKYYPSHNTKLLIVPDVGHSHTKMFGSEIGRSAIFDTINRKYIYQ